MTEKRKSFGAGRRQTGCIPLRRAGRTVAASDGSRSLLPPDEKTGTDGCFAGDVSINPGHTGLAQRKYGRCCLCALYLCYMIGLGPLQTQEVLRDLEADGTRAGADTQDCLDGVRARLAEFESTHVRRGQLYVGVAFVQGKGDSFTPPLHRDACDGSTGMPEKSWDHVRIFYPGARTRRVKGSPRFFCSYGPFTSNPYGDIDIIPAQEDVSVMSEYRCLIMAGWNTADADFSRRMLEYVRGGGTLLLTWAHLYTTADREQALSHRSEILFNDDIRELTGIRSVDFSTDVPRLETDFPAGSAQYIEHSVGEGRVILVNSKCYPSEKPIRRLYASLVRGIARENRKYEALFGWVSSDGCVYTAAYDAPDRRTFYLLDVRWWRSRPHTARAVLHMGEAVCGFPVKRDVLNVMTMFNGVAVLTADNTTDIIACDGQNLTLQGEGKTKIVLFKWVDGEIDITEKWLELNGITTERI